VIQKQQEKEEKPVQQLQQVPMPVGAAKVHSLSAIAASAGKKLIG